MSNSNRELTSDDSNLSKFNHNLSLLFVQLMKAYPDDKDLKLYYDKFEWSKKFNAKAVCEYFIHFTSPYIKEIMTENERFFLHELDFTEHLKQEKYLNLLEKIMELWKNSDNQKLKKNIWRFFQVLLTYGIKVLNRRDLGEILNQYRTQPLVF